MDEIFLPPHYVSFAGPGRMCRDGRHQPQPRQGGALPARHRHLRWLHVRFIHYEDYQAYLSSLSGKFLPAVLAVLVVLLVSPLDARVHCLPLASPPCFWMSCLSWLSIVHTCRHSGYPVMTFLDVSCATCAALPPCRAALPHAGVAALPAVRPQPASCTCNRPTVLLTFFWPGTLMQVTNSTLDVTSWKW